MLLPSALQWLCFLSNLRPRAAANSSGQSRRHVAGATARQAITATVWTAASGATTEALSTASGTQQVAEALVLLVALRVWGRFLRASSATADLRGDSTAALAIAGKLAPSSPVLNFLGAEHSLTLEAELICEALEQDGRRPVQA